MLQSFGCPIQIETVRIKYLDNIVEQDHRIIKKRIRPMLGFKSFVSASATLEGIEGFRRKLCRVGAVKGT